jgi:hypothetical protein
MQSAILPLSADNKSAAVEKLQSLAKENRLSQGTSELVSTLEGLVKLFSHSGDTHG